MDTTVAETILDQLRGRTPVAFLPKLIGASRIVLCEKSLRIIFKRGAATNKNGSIDRLEISLDYASDTYDVEVGRWDAKKLEVKRVEMAHGVYCDTLQKTVETMTGLYFTL